MRAPRRCALQRRGRRALRTALLRAATCALGAAALGQELVVRGPDPAVVKPGGEALVTFSLEHFSGAAELAPPPALDGLEVRIGAPRASAFQTLVDGRVWGYPLVTWEVALRPAREGRFELPPLEVRAGERRFASPALQFECVQRIDGARWAFVELAAPRASFFAGEPLRVALRFGFDREFLQTNMTQISSAELDVPVQVRAPWLDAPQGAVALAEEPRATLQLDGDRRMHFALDERQAEAVRIADREREGRTFAVFELERTYVAPRGGELVLPAPALSFACATRFTEDLFGSPVPVDWQTALVWGRPLALRIEPLPEQGRPADFGGAVGRFTVRAEAAPREVEVGGRLALVLTIEGEGNLELFDAPRLGELDGFHELGRIDDKRRSRRTLSCDLRPLRADLRELPALAFSYFDPAERAYRTLHTEPLPLRVRQPAPAPPAKGFAVRGSALLLVAALGAGLILVAVGSVLVFLRRPRRGAQG